MVGNSSSGIIEAASVELPVVNVGVRQRGRIRPGNVIDVDCRKADIVAAIDRATSPRFRDTLDQLQNPYGNGHAARRIVDRLKQTQVDELFFQKPFHDLQGKAA